ncbi:Chaperone protein dnaJ 49 [Cocos nucifera]|uniref:Chaperone protein dnaJ 49 n=1 Tax=Cocos nucifera TaxID=13894 RepID=A0A8K0IJF2_COCNU|nr:Chaperone protein dnaJ 49 [Cocos nucifera]
MAAEDEEAPAPEVPEAEALRLKSLAEEKLRSSSLKSALKYAKRAARLRPDLDGVSQMVTALKILRAAPSDHYKVLRLPPFSLPSSIRRQYKTLALALHPDKSSSSAPSAAAAAAADAFKRVADSFHFLSDRGRKRDFDLSLRLAKEKEATAAAEGPVETFWTACTTCRLLHEFDRRYVGYRLVCPGCRKSFLAVEVPPSADDDGGKPENSGSGGAMVRVTRSRSNTRPRIPRFPPLAGDDKRKAEVSRVSTSPASKKLSQRPEKTLAEMQKELAKGKVKEKKKEKEKEKESKEKNAIVPRKHKDDDLSLMAVEDSDFYDFDKDRTEKSFRKGQIWAIYDDDDGMPRHYGLIEEVFSSNPFRVKMSWLDMQNHGDESLVLWEKSGFHISCGRFKFGRKVDIDSVNFFSHLVECERAARDVYRIYPKKGSVWALYDEGTLGGKEGRYYDIVVFLTSYSEMHGLSMAYLEKVEGYRTIFKRRAIGSHAVKWLEKDDVRLFSHQIPARKLSQTEGPNLPRECWELDPASLPPELLAICWDR